MNKRLIKILLLVITFIFFSLNVYASNTEKINEDTNYKIIIEDDANLLSDEEINKLEDEMMSLTKYGNIAFKTIDHNNTSTDYYAREYYHEEFGTSSGTVFLIDMDNRNIYIFSDGYNYTVINKDKAHIITDNIYIYASREDYYECASKAFEQMNTLLEGSKISEPMRHISNALISLVVAFLINFIIVLKATKISRAENKEVLKNCDISFEVNNIVGKKTGVDRVYSPVSESSGGSSGGGSSGGGGGSSGGGGGHSF